MVAGSILPDILPDILPVISGVCDSNAHPTGIQVVNASR